MSRKLLIPWSGGWDSTLIILQAIQDNIEFETCYLELKNNKNQQENELANRDLLRILIEKEFGKTWKDNKFSFTDIVSCNTTTKSKQPFIWFATLIWNVDPDKIKEISFGYLRTSHIWHNLNHFKKAFKHSLKFTKLHSKHKDIKLTFPLEWYNKKDVVNSLKSLFGDVYPMAEFLMQTCENPIDGIVCGVCEKCKDIDSVK
jgi:7-cyano-7-deazaguanine synthase in queuosine biosynthesis